MRTALLWLASPADYLVRLVSGRGDLPPLWLRRHVGPVGEFARAAAGVVDLIGRLDLVRAGSRVLDAGCGCGAMVPGLACLLGASGEYVGFDVHRGSIRWCRRHFREDPRLRFELAEVKTPYSQSARGAVEIYRFPVGSQAVDFILAKSLFTHLTLAEARHYLAEIKRTLAPSGRALVTVFLFDPSSPDILDSFPFASLDGQVRWRVRARPHAAIAYERRLFERLVAEAGLTVVEMIVSFWPGSGQGQDVLVLGG
ncbi:MAG TPA: class I SAM-dependent methyltransferase [Thermoanaerobaculia bacterium]|nr:class I SAM-dependent methyltransferase [Thermoanaerobaculia bacterium]